PFRTESKFHGELARISLGGRDVLLLKPGTFMNRSGQAVQALVQFYKLSPGSVLIAHDELDLPAGDMRLKAGGGHGGHNGLRDIHKVLGPDYLRLRIGIGHPGDKNLVLNYVLGRASKNDETAILDAFDDAGSAVETWLTRGWERALTQLHTRPVPPAGGAS
ncbi:MAG TPA: aminoacyl-tRNA hydrolase, partial [Solimonas sp.]